MNVGVTGTNGKTSTTHFLASALGATGTPLFVVGDRVLNSAVGYDVLKKAVADARASR